LNILIYKQHITLKVRLNVKVEEHTKFDESQRIISLLYVVLQVMSYSV